MTDDDMRNMGKSPDFGTPDIMIQDESQTTTAAKSKVDLNLMLNTAGKPHHSSTERRAYS